MAKQKLKLQDKVKIKQAVVKWYLSHEGQSAYFPPNGILDKEQEKSHDKATMVMLLLAMDSDITGEVVDCHYVDIPQLENYRVLILGTEFNIEPKYLVKV